MKSAFEKLRDELAHKERACEILQEQNNDLADALEQAKAALGDRLLGNGPLSKEYAHGVVGRINLALRAVGRL